MKRDIQTTRWQAHLVILEYIGWSQRHQTEPHGFTKCLTFTDYHNQSAQCPKCKAMLQKASVAVLSEY